MSEEREIVTSSGAGLMDEFTGETELVEKLERRMEQFKKFKVIALKMTEESDWADQNGKPYMMGSGAEKVARPFGISWKILKDEKIISKDDVGEFYYYIFFGEFRFGRETIEVVGTCSSRDQFFAKMKKIDENGKVVFEKGKTVYELKPLSEIDETNIKKSAYTNMVVNGVTRIIGLRGISYDDLHAAGIDTSKITKVEYKQGGRKSVTSKISEPQLKRLFAIAWGVGKDEEYVKSVIKANYKYEHAHDIQIKDYDDICKYFENLNFAK